MDERMRSGRKTVLEGRRLAEMKLMIDQNLCLPITSFLLNDILSEPPQDIKTGQRFELNVTV